MTSCEQSSGHPVFDVTIDLDGVGKQMGSFLIPEPSNESGWRNLTIPVVSIKNGSGPCVLITAGTHGDEYEGQIALRDFARSVRDSDVSGQILIVPSLNMPAVAASTRLSPLDGRDLNRSFPGNRHGSITEKIACFVYQELISRADIVLDLHAGGHVTNMMPSVLIHTPSRLQSLEHFERTRAAAIAFGAPLILVIEELDHHGLMDSAVEEQGKIFLCAELGGLGGATPSTLAITNRGIKNVLAHFEVLNGRSVTAGEEPRILTSAPGSFVTAQDDGLLEPLFEVGESVPAGATVAKIHSISHIGRAPSEHIAECGGFLFARRVRCPTAIGDVLTCVAQPWEG